MTQQISPETIYEECLSIWVHGWDDAYAAGLSKDEKHQVRRQKLVEYLKTIDVPQLIQTIEGRLVDIDAFCIENPKRREYYKREKAAANAILTVVRKGWE